MSKYNILLGFFLLLLPQIDVGFYQIEPKSYTSTCASVECQSAISMCVDTWKCFGQYQCTSCIDTYEKCDKSCLTDLLDQNEYITINDEGYLPCNRTSQLEIRACQLHCRILFYRYSQCTIIDVYSVCNCSSQPFISTTTPPTTTRPLTTTNPNYATLVGHEGYVNYLRVLENGDLASGSDDRSILIWDASTFQLKRNLTGHKSWVSCLAALSNGDLASGSFDKTILIWDIENGLIKQNLTGHTSFVNDLAVLKVSGNLASAGHDYTVRIWNPNMGQLVRTLTGHKSAVYSLAFLNNGLLASGGYSSPIKLWNVETGRLVSNIYINSQYVWSMCALSNGELAFTKNYNKSYEIEIVSDNTITITRTIKAHMKDVSALAQLPNGDLASASDDNSIKIWNLSTGALKKTFNGHTNFIKSLVVLKNGLLVSASWDKTIKIWFT
jgi:WD40 repeat protein